MTSHFLQNRKDLVTSKCFLESGNNMADNVGAFSGSTSSAGSSALNEGASTSNILVDDSVVSIS